LWQGVEDRIQAASGGWIKPIFFWRIIVTYLRLIIKYLSINKYDILIVGYPGQMDIFIARFLSWLYRRPLVWDVLMSIYLVTIERKLNQKSPITASFLHLIEKLGLRLPDLLIIEGEEYARWLCNEYQISISRFRYVPLGTNHKEFPYLGTSPALDGRFRVVYFGSFLRSHGLDLILESASILKTERDISFEFIGDGPERETIMKQAQYHGLKQISFPGFLSRKEFFEHLTQADLCLGVFGNTLHSRITVQNKIYEALIMGKPLLTGDSDALRQIFEPGKHLYVCERTPEAIAQSILYLRDHYDERIALAKQGREFVIQHYTIEVLGSLFLEQIEPLLRR
jgi:glycosyltransferase involved in cell wall biosynthesis